MIITCFDTITLVDKVKVHIKIVEIEDDRRY